MYNKIRLKEGAIFVADSHDGKFRGNFLIFLNRLKNKEIITPQLFLMGDMFDLLTKLEYTEKIYKEYINLLNFLSNEIEIHYFEGNHDFLLKKIFPKVNIYTIKSQPIEFFYEDKRFLLSHGDKNEKLGYKIYTFLIRNNLLVKFINILDKNFNYFISKKILNIQYSKDICRKLNKFEEKITEQLKYYKDYNFVIEGHFHQGDRFLIGNINYINIPSLFCTKSFVILKKNLNFMEDRLIKY